MDELVTTGQRLRQFRLKEAGESREKFIKGLDITARTLERYENDESMPDAQFFTRLNAKYHGRLNLDWLLTGRGDLYMAEPSAGGLHVRQEPGDFRDVILDRMHKQLDLVYAEKDFQKLAALQSLLNLLSPED